MLAQQTTSLSGGVADPAELLAAAALGDGLSEDAERCLRAAAGFYHDEARAERHLFEARRLAPTHVAVLIGLYRFYFYKGRLKDALDIAQQCLARASLDNSLPLDWRKVKPAHGRFDDFDAVAPRGASSGFNHDAQALDLLPGAGDRRAHCVYSAIGEVDH